MSKTFLMGILVTLVCILASCETTYEKLYKYQSSGNVAKLIELLVKDTSHHMAIRNTLLRMKDPRSVEPLIAVLNNKQSGIWPRSSAATILGVIGEPRAVEPLIIALKDEDESVRGNAARALGNIGDPRAVEPLIAALNDEVRWIRANAAGALGNIRDNRAVEPLIFALKDEYDDTRMQAAKALGNIGDSRAVEPLIAMMKDKEDDVREETTVALGKIGDRRAVEPLIAVLNDKNWGIQVQAAEALGTIGDPRAGDSLIALLRPKVFEPVAEKAAWALEKIGDPRATNAYNAWKTERAKRAQMKQPEYNRTVKISLGPGQQFNLMVGMDVSRVFSELEVAIFLEEPMTVVCESVKAYAINKDGLAVPAAVSHAKTADGGPAMISFNSYGAPSLVIRWKE